MLENGVRLPIKIVIGKFSKRAFDINNCGGKIVNLTWKDAKITKEGIETVKKHLSRFEDVPANKKMIKRLEDIDQGLIDVTDYDKRFYTHEVREYERYRNLGYENHMNDLIPEGIYNNAHSATLEDFKIYELSKNGNSTLYHPEISDLDFVPDLDRKILGI